MTKGKEGEGGGLPTQKVSPSTFLPENDTDSSSVLHSHAERVPQWQWLPIFFLGPAFVNFISGSVESGHPSVCYWSIVTPATDQPTSATHRARLGVSGSPDVTGSAVDDTAGPKNIRLSAGLTRWPTDWCSLSVGGGRRNIFRAKNTHLSCYLSASAPLGSNITAHTGNADP